MPDPLADAIALTIATASTGLATAASTNFTTGAGGRYLPDDGTTTGSAGAATLSKQAGVVTTEALTTAGLAAYTLTLTNTLVAVGDMVLVSVGNGTNTQGMPMVSTVTTGSESVVIVVQNRHATEALNGTLKICFVLFNA